MDHAPAVRPAPLSRVNVVGPMQVGLLLAAIWWILDQATKALVVQALVPGRRVALPGPLFLQLTFNEGAAFGLPVPWWVFPVVTAVVVTLVVRNLPRARSMLDWFAYGLLLGGALGNVTDRFVRPHPAGFARGEVIDFIASPFWPTFNLADVGITVGFALLLLAAYRADRTPPRGSPTEQRDARPEPAGQGAAGHAAPVVRPRTAAGTEPAPEHLPAP